MDWKTKTRIEDYLITGLLNDRLEDLLSGGSIYGENFSGIGWAFKTVTFKKYLCESFPICLSGLNDFNQVLAVYSRGKPEMEIPEEEYLLKVKKRRAGDFRWFGPELEEMEVAEEDEVKEGKDRERRILNDFGLWAGSYYIERIEDLSDGSLYGSKFTGVGWAFIDKDPPPNFHLYNSLHSRIMHEAGRPGCILAWYSNGQPIMPYDMEFIKQELESGGERFKRDKEVLEAMIPDDFKKAGDIEIALALLKNKK